MHQYILFTNPSPPPPLQLKKRLEGLEEDKAAARAALEARVAEQAAQVEAERAKAEAAAAEKAAVEARLAEQAAALEAEAKKAAAAAAEAERLRTEELAAAEERAKEARELAAQVDADGWGRGKWGRVGTSFLDAADAAQRLPVCFPCLSSHRPPPPSRFPPLLLHSAPPSWRRRRPRSRRRTRPSPSWIGRTPPTCSSGWGVFRE